jgi:hypothetical protein
VILEMYRISEPVSDQVSTVATSDSRLTTPIGQ